MSALHDKANPYFYCSITNDVEVTAPTFVCGETPATPGASFLISSSGARMAKTLTMGLTTVAYNGAFLMVAKTEGNLMIVHVPENPSRSIARINHSTADRFPVGTVITFLFPEAGTTVANSGYLKLKNTQSFTSTVDSSLTLMADGDATWTEISRNV